MLVSRTTRFFLVTASAIAIVSGQQGGGGDGLDHLRSAIPGEPGKDYPIHGIDILCKVNPTMAHCRNSGNAGGGGGGGGGQQQQQQGGNGKGNENRGGRTNKDEFYNQIASGEIPGVAGKDYPVNSVQALTGRFNGIQVAPADLITPDYPGSSSKSNNNRGAANRGRPQTQGRPQNRQRPRGNNQGSNSNAVPSNNSRRQQQPPQQQPRQQQPRQQQPRQQQPRQQQPRQQQPRQQQRPQARPQQAPRRRPQPQPAQPRRPQQPQPRRPQQQPRPQSAPAPPLPIRNGGSDEDEKQQLPNGKYCPGGALDHCINFCPRDTYAECVAECGNAC